VLVGHSLTSSCVVEEWAPALLGTGAHFALDTSTDFIICANFIGSPYGSSSPLRARQEAAACGADDEASAAASGAFPSPITVADNVRAQHTLMCALGVRSVAFAVGGSLGAMLVLEYAATHPGMVRSVALVAGAASATPWSLGANAAQRAAVAADARWRGGAYAADDPPAAGLAAARQAAMLTYRAPEGLQQRFAAPHGAPLRQSPAEGRSSSAWSIESWLEHAATSLLARFDAACYVALTHTLDSHHVSAPRCALVTCPAFVLGVSSDMLYPLPVSRALAAALPHGALHVLHSPHGHDAFLIELAEVGARVRDFRRSLHAARACSPPLPPHLAPRAPRPVYAKPPSGVWPPAGLGTSIF
jgi:homoserine O-acetyltransferase